MKVVKETLYIPMQCKLSDRKSLRDIRSDMLINKLKYLFSTSIASYKLQIA